MERHILTDQEWNAISNYLPKQRPGKAGRPWADHRMTINGILWVLCVGAPWRDVPESFGKWQTIYKRFRRWTQEGVWNHIWMAILTRADQRGRVDRKLWCVDGSIVRAHHAAVGGSSCTSRSAAENALGRSRGGYSTKLHIVCDGNGLPLGVTATGGNINEPTEFLSLMESVGLSLFRKASRPDALAGDKAYVAGYIFDWLTSKQIRNVIPNRKNENKNPSFCRQTYRRRNVVERLIGRLKHFRRIATRYEKTVESYIAMTQLAFLRITIKVV